MKLPFLTDEWIAEAKRIRTEIDGQPRSVAHPMKMNLIVNEVPFGDGHVNAHIDTSTGSLLLDAGHLPDPDVTVTVDYATAKAMLVDGNAQAAMQAFMTGKVQVEGDISKLMVLQSGGFSPVTQELATRIRQMTE